MPLLRFDSPFKIAWNIVILMTILCFSFLITYSMAFKAFSPDALYYGLNSLYFLDIFICLVSRVKRGHLRIDDLAGIRRHYLRTWFIVDLASFIPFELIIVAIYGQVPDAPEAFHLYLALQSLTLIKLLKAIRIFDELQEALSVSPAIRRLASFAWWFTQAIHLMALGWVLIGASENARSHFDQYLRSLYWVTTTIATIGYGDYYPNHESNVQIAYTIGVQLFGVGMYSFVIANISSMMTNFDVSRTAYQRHLDVVNSFLRAQRIPHALQERVRDYYSYLWAQRRSMHAAAVLDDLPPSLSMEILMHQNGDLIRRLEVFKDAEELFIREALKALRTCVFLPNEHIIHQGERGDAMYFLSSGEVSVMVDGREVATLGPGSVFGEAALVTDERRNASVKALSYGTGYRLPKQDFQSLRARYPEFDRRVSQIVAERAAMNQTLRLADPAESD